MLNVPDLIIKTMKKEIFSSSDSSNKAARQVLAELKTKFIDIQEPITAEIQYKLLKKMGNDRQASCETYIKANRNDLATKESTEYLVIMDLMKQLEADLPKMMTEDEIKNKIQETIKDIPNEKLNMGIIMKTFKDIKNVDKALVSKIAKEFLSNK